MPNKTHTDVEGIVEEFIKWAESPARPEDETKTYTQNAAEWIKIRLQSQADQYERQKGEMVKEILDSGLVTKLFHNGIKDIAQKYGVDLSE